jgi:glycosyltransferase involved in cell wall biosynthesis
VRPKIIISVRRSDVQDRWAKAVPWENVDLLAQIGSCAVEEALLSQVPDLRRRTRLVVVPNGVNLRRYPLRRRDRGKHLACLGCLTMEANPGFLVQCMQKLHYLEAGYRLFFSGRFENSTLEQYVRHMVRTLDLTSVISFEPDPGDLNGWLSDKHFIVAAGIGENQVEALLAGMACGLKPVVHNFPGADKLLPPQYLFNIAEQFCEQVLSHDYQPAQYRRLVEERYPVEQQLKRVEVILAQLETEIELQAVAALGKETSIVSNETGVSVAADGVR